MIVTPDLKERTKEKKKSKRGGKCKAPQDLHTL
jgi:hypothetical protein